jgi:hypothetical protein
MQINQKIVNLKTMTCLEKDLYPEVFKLFKKEFPDCEILPQHRTSTGSSIVDFLVVCPERKIKLVGEVKACEFDILKTISQINRYAQQYSAPSYTIKKILFIPLDKNLTPQEWQLLLSNNIIPRRINIKCNCD